METRKVAVITGASQGIGAGLVAGFRKRGYRVVANSRSIKPRRDDPISSGRPGRHRRPGVADRVIGTAVERSAASTRWSTTPASSSPSRSPSTPHDDFDHVLGVNLAGFFHVTQRAVAADARRRAAGTS